MTESFFVFLDGAEEAWSLRIAALPTWTGRDLAKTARDLVYSTFTGLPRVPLQISHSETGAQLDLNANLGAQGITEGTVLRVRFRPHQPADVEAPVHLDAPARREAPSPGALCAAFLAGGFLAPRWQGDEIAQQQHSRTFFCTLILASCLTVSRIKTFLFFCAALLFYTGGVLFGAWTTAIATKIVSNDGAGSAADYATVICIGALSGTLTAIASRMVNWWFEANLVHSAVKETAAKLMQNRRFHELNEGA
jgi:hypothetical protein